MLTPRVSVLMTTWNGAAFLRDSLASVFAQTMPDFELVVVDDASTDDTAGILGGCGDARLRVLGHARNLGIVAARNAGFAVCRAPYVAMLDHDDLSAPDRLARQMARLDAQASLVAVGSALRMLENGRLRGSDHPQATTPTLLRWMLHVDNPLAWSSLMLRRDAVLRLGAFVRPDYECADDFDLLHRLLRLGEVGRIDAPLITYRFHAANTSRLRPAAMFDNAVRVLADCYAPWLDAAAADSAARLVVRHLSERQPVTDGATLDRLGAVMERLLDGFCAIYAPDAARAAPIRAQAAATWWRVVRAAARSGRPWLATHYRARRALRAGFRPAAADVLVALGVGGVRAALRR